jgi:uncharacterized protein YbjT (DUF2867 family)
MHIIIGGTGRVGAATAQALLAKGEMVTIVSRTKKAESKWKSMGAAFAVADIEDTKALHDIFRKGKSAFILNPSADPATNTTENELATGRSIVEALKESGIKKVVVASTLSAQPGHCIGDLRTLYALEQRIATLSIPYTIIRSAYYMSNWMNDLPMVEATGELMSFLPVERKIPMVAPADIGELASALLLKPYAPEITSLEGPERYSPEDVRAVFSTVLKRPVTLKVVPEDALENMFRSFGFSEHATQSYAGMTRVLINTPELPNESIKGKTSLEEYVRMIMR